MSEYLSNNVSSYGLFYHYTLDIYIGIARHEGIGSSHSLSTDRNWINLMIWNLDMKLTEVEGINHLFELFEMNLDLMKHPECVLWSLLQLISLGCGLGGDVLSNPDHNQIRCRVHLAFICVSVATQIRD
eukprot:372573_1